MDNMAKIDCDFEENLEEAREERMKKKEEAKEEDLRVEEIE